MPISGHRPLFAVSPFPGRGGGQGGGEAATQAQAPERRARTAGRGAGLPAGVLRSAVRAPRHTDKAADRPTSRRRNHCQGFAGGTHQGRSGAEANLLTNYAAAAAHLSDKLSAPQRATPYSFERGRRPAGGQLLRWQARAVTPQERSDEDSKKTRRSGLIAPRRPEAPVPIGALPRRREPAPMSALMRCGPEAAHTAYYPVPQGIAARLGRAEPAPPPRGRLPVETPQGAKRTRTQKESALSVGGFRSPRGRLYARAGRARYGLGGEVFRIAS